MQGTAVMSIFVALICLVAVGELARAGHPSDSLEWALFKRQHRKSYSGSEDVRRFANFLRNKAYVENHNANSTHSYKLGLNHMSDWSEDEFGSINGIKAELPLKRNLSVEQESFLNAILNDPTPLPKEVDWRKVEGRVSGVGKQGSCSSAWAFATTGLLEGQQIPLNVTQKEVIKLSEQDLIDCSDQNDGCYGGLVSRALKDVQKMGGIMREDDYPYADKAETCMFRPNSTVMTVLDATILPKNDEEALKKAVAMYGPVAISMFVRDKLLFYRSGVFSDKSCKFQKYLNHVALVIGYGTDPKAGDFWILKNSWSSEWGDKGYFKMTRGSNMCNVASMATIARF